MFPFISYTVPDNQNQIEQIVLINNATDMTKDISGFGKLLQGMKSRDPSIGAMSREAIQSKIPVNVLAIIDTSLLSDGSNKYNYKSLTNTMKNFISNKAEKLQYALITHRDIVKDIYTNYVTNKSVYPLINNQPYACESMSTRIDLSQDAPTITILRRNPNPRPIDFGVLNLSDWARYGKRCKWLFNLPMPNVTAAPTAAKKTGFMGLFTRKGGRRPIKKGKYRYTRKH